MRVKWIIAAVGVLIIVAIAAIFIIISRFDYNMLKPRVAQAVYDATGRKLTMAGDIKLKFGFRPVLSVENVSLANADWGSQSDMATVKQLEVQVALIPLLRRNVRVNRLILINPDILVETDRGGKSNLKFEPPPAKKGEARQPEQAKPLPDKKEVKAPQFTFEQVRVENARLTYKDGKTGKTQIVILSELTAAASNETVPVELTARGAYNENPFNLDGTVGSIAGINDPSKPWPVKLRAETLETDINLDGSIKDVKNAKGIDFTMTAEGKTLVPIAALAGLHEIPDPGPFRIESKITDPADKTYKLSDLSVSLKDSDITGSIEIMLAGKRPRLNATLSSKKIDVRSILAKKEEVEAEQPTVQQEPKPSEEKERSGRIFSEKSLPLDIVKTVDGKVNIQAGQILLPKLALDNLTTEILLEDGTLTVRPIKASTGGGTFDGHAQLSAKSDPADLSLTLKINQLNLGRMLGELGITERIQGNLDADVELAGRGTSVAGIMSGLNGKTVAMMSGARVNNKYLALLERNIGAGLFSLLNPAAEGENYTDLNCFVNRFDIKDGIANATVLLVDTTSMTVAGSGNIDLKTERLNLSLLPSPKKGVGAQAGSKISLNLGQLANPFKLGGTLAKPRLALDTQKSAAMIGKALGGTGLFGPAGSSAAKSAEEDPCAAAKRIAEAGPAAGAQKQQQKKDAVGQTTDDASNAAKDAVGGARQQLKKLLGK